ncbi:Polycomb protein Asx [Eumeta japonica]|uniref:Polycomb protein Asx n=1 Tax=Eumeta variegata TaxID=151549 RepID=A0A4C1VDE2_EUMVA|nr:Polycomb protein Asx [Eumeta japonica]
MEVDVTTHANDSNIDYSDNLSENKYLTSNNEQFAIVRFAEGETVVSSEKSNKHSSRKQSKRRRKNSNHSRPLPRIIVKPLPPPPPEPREWVTPTYSDINSNSSKPQTMREVLASIPGFCIKTRKRSSKKLSTAAQLQQTKEGCIDLETPDSILVNTNIRALLNKHTFSLLPPLYQYKLGQLLPSVDRPSSSGRLSSSSLNNEFFSRACLEWQDSLSGGEFTPENQQKMKTEAEKEKSKIDPWKLKHFEPFWGEKFQKDRTSLNLNSERPSLKTTIKLRPTASITSSSTVPKIKKSKSSGNSKKLRSTGAVTRAASRAEDCLDEPPITTCKSSAPVPDLLPLKMSKSHNRGYVECPVDFNFSDSSVLQRTDESVTTTPVDPLLLENDNEINENKEQLHINVVAIEETDSSKSYEDNKIDYQINSPVVLKRLSDENDDCSVVKRIKFEECNVRDIKETLNFLSGNTEDAHNYSDIEPTYINDQVLEDNDLNNSCDQDRDVDTNSEDSKVTSLYDYEDRSNSSLSSLKNDKFINTEIESNISIQNNITLEHSPDKVQLDSNSNNNFDLKEENINSFIPVQQEEYISNMIIDNPVNVESDQNTETGVDTVTDENKETVIYENVENAVSISKTENQKILVSSEEDNTDCVEREEATHNVTHNYTYDEHFRDAESFILETGALSALAPTHSSPDDGKYTSHASLMELSSYMNEANVTAVVTMPMPHNSVLPVMEVTNTAMVSYPDDNAIQDQFKSKNTSMVWKPDAAWPANESIVPTHNFTDINADKAKYMNEDSKIMEVNTISDGNNTYKEERDANFNMESSNSSESCQSLKDTPTKQELEQTIMSAPSTTISNSSATSSAVTQTIRLSTATKQKGKSAKESNRNRSSNKVPPGAVNLERSYQICQAVIQNSPNRDALRGQLRPPPALLTRPARAARQPPPPVLVRQIPVNIMPHVEINENRPNNMGQYILVQRTPNAAPRASSAPPANQNSNIMFTMHDRSPHVTSGGPRPPINRRLIVAGGRPSYNNNINFVVVTREPLFPHAYRFYE